MRFPYKFAALLVTATLLAGNGVSSTSAIGNGPTSRDATAAAKKGGASSSLYIVQMLAAPVAGYTGGIAGLKATKPAAGKKIDTFGKDVVDYSAYLDSTHNAALARVGGGRKAHSYHFAFNGFAAELTDAQAAALGASSDVVAVTKDSMSKLDTSSTPNFLGLTGAGGAWSMLGGVGSAGEDVVIGIVDSGIWPEHLSFSDRTGANGNASKDGKLSYQQIPGWNGRCVPGEGFPASACNQKLIAARWFNQGFGGDAGVKANFPYEFNSARDADGHGSHTASTAGGNSGVVPTGDAASFAPISGMAPRARIAAYKTCWGNGGEGGCFNSDNVAAIDQAVADGVDVINFSISGTSTNFRDPVEIAFLFAADAGIVVATSSGNSGPTASTTNHPSPWLITVGASTHNRAASGQVSLGNAAVYNGASSSSVSVSGPLVLAENVKLGSAPLADARLCFLGTLDPAMTAGKIVVCDRGVNARAEKSLAVKQAGGIGMVLVNTSVNSLNADIHYVPTVHLDAPDTAAVKAYAATPGATATLSPGGPVPPAPQMASFSSRGPTLATGDILKPDITAPGVDVLAAVSPIGNNGRLFDMLSGTSMSSPHMAGLAALMKQKHPSWSAAMIKSALMTTAYQITQGDVSPFAQGAGHVDVKKAFNPGLVYNAGFGDYVAFICGTGQLSGPLCASTIDPSDLNLPSIAIGDMSGAQTVKRTVTHVGSGSATYNASVSGLPGLDVSVNPASITLAPGQSATYRVTFTRTTATLDTYTTGALTWTSGSSVVRSPVVIRPVVMASPAQINGSGASGNANANLRFGFSGAFAAKPHGLVPASTIAGTVADDPADNFVKDGPGTTKHTITIPAGVRYVRFALFDTDTDGNDDLDMYVYSGAGLVGASGNGTSDEEVNLNLGGAAPITLDVYVHGWQTDGPAANYTLSYWALTPTAAGNMTVSAPATVTIGDTGTANIAWSGLTGGRWLGSVTWHDPATAANAWSPRAGMTVVRVDVP